MPNVFLAEDYSIVFLIIGIILLVGILISLYYFLNKQGREWQQLVTKKLSILDKLASSKDVYQLRSALIEADKLLDYVFRAKRVKGETMGERLKNAKAHFSWNDYQNIWEAHKLRNKLAHEIEFNPSAKELEEKYRFLRKALKSL